MSHNLNGGYQLTRHRYLDALFYTADGNFQQSQKMKPSDPNDEPLTLGAAFYAHEHDFAYYQANRGKEKKEVCV